MHIYISETCSLPASLPSASADRFNETNYSYAFIRAT